MQMLVAAFLLTSEMAMGIQTAKWSPFEAAAKPAALKQMPIRPKYANVETQIHTGGGSNGIELLWQRPAGPIKGIFIGVHGGARSGGDFFPPTMADGWVFEDCKYVHTNKKQHKCNALTENINMFKIARARGYLTLAMTGEETTMVDFGGGGFFSSMTEMHMCYSNDKDPKRLAEGVRHVLQQENLTIDTPLLISGASAGAQFVYFAEAELIKQNFVVKCVNGQIGMVNGATNRSLLRAPTVVEYMPKDSGNRNGNILRTAKEMEGMDIPVKIIAVNAEHPETMMLARGYSNATTKAVIGALSMGKILDADGYLKKKPQNDQSWKKVLQKQVPADLLNDALIHDESPLEALLEACFADHDVQSFHTEEVLDFCEQNWNFDQSKVHKTSKFHEAMSEDILTDRQIGELEKHFKLPPSKRK